MPNFLKALRQVNEVAYTEFTIETFDNYVTTHENEAAWPDFTILKI